jgi:hypothetical protein
VDTFDLKSQQIAEIDAEVEEYERKIVCLKRKRRELRWQAFETEEGEISHFDDVA